MAGRRDIEAGRAFVSLALNDSAFVKGLRTNGERLKNFGRGMATIGVGITAAGAAILAPLSAMQRSFLELGDTLDKMRQRTGISVEALSELEHAAGQSAATIADVEKGVRKMQQNIGKAGEVSKDFADTLEFLGLNLETLRKLSPEQQFDLIAKRVGAIEDPTRRAAVAMAVFGKAGTQLLPMIEDMDALREEARRMGFVMSGEAAAGAVKLGDLLANFWKTVRFAGHALSEALMPHLTEGVKIIQAFATGILKWIQANKQLVVGLAAAAAVVSGLGLILTGLGLSIALVGVAMKGLAAGIGVVGSVLGVLLTPLGLIATSLTAGAVLWALYTQSGQAAMAKLGEVFGDLLTTAKMTFGGISDALVAGDLAIAGSIAMAGLKVALLTGLDAIADAVGGALGDFLGSLGADILNGDLSSAWTTAIEGMYATWSTFAEGMVAVFTDAMRGVLNAWESVTGKISDFILKNASEGGWLGKLALLGTGVDMQAEAARAAELDAKLRARGVDPGAGFLEGAQQSARDQLRGTADSFRDRLSGLDAGAQGRTDAAANAVRNRTRGGANQGLTDAQAELERLRAEAAKARQDAEKEASKRREQTATEDAEPDMASKVFGTFSAAALQATGQNNPAVTEQKKTNKELSELNKTQQDALEFIKATGAWT